MDKNIVYEMCPYCDKEVKLEAKLHEQYCPNCNQIIKPCALCDMDTVNCNKCSCIEIKL